MDNRKIIVFDLDGTLYQDTHHFGYYAQQLSEKLAPEKKAAFIKDYDVALAGNHPLKIGTVYDVKNDLILIQDNNQVTKAYTWEGESVSKEKLSSLYPEQLQYDFRSMLNVGDLWWVPGAIARHYQITDEAADKAFIETREYMMTDAFQMEIVPGFKELLHQLANEKKLVLFTNSPEVDSEVILTKIGIQDVFDYKIFNGKKPIETKRHLQFIKDHYRVEYDEILCIGDNAINEVFPAQALGCETILIDPHLIHRATDADFKVDTIQEVMEILKR